MVRLILGSTKGASSRRRSKSGLISVSRQWRTLLSLHWLPRLDSSQGGWRSVLFVCPVPSLMFPSHPHQTRPGPQNASGEVYHGFRPVLRVSPGPRWCLTVKCAGGLHKGSLGKAGGPRLWRNRRPRASFPVLDPYQGRRPQHGVFCGIQVSMACRS